MIEQKMICYNPNQINAPDGYNSLNNYLKEGWVIKSIQSVATRIDAYCFVLLERKIAKEDKVIDE